MAQKEDREIAKIRGFLARELTEFGVKHRARHLVTSPEEITRHTGLDVKVVRKWLSRAAGKKVDGKVVIIRVGRTDVIIRLTR